jgi:hypothetical protein
MKPEDFALGTARVEFWELDRLRLSAPMDEQIDELKEDLAQVRFGEDIVLDVGWYRSLPPAGRFVVYVIARGDWSNPAFQGDAVALDELVALIREATECSKSLSDGGPIQHRQ